MDTPHGTAMGYRLQFVTAALILVVPVFCTSEVKEKTSSYSCCGSARIEFDPTCEHTWSAHNMTFAYINRGIKECVSPCKDISDGWIVLDACLAVNVTVICVTAHGPEETIISYLGHECRYSGMKPGSQCAIGLRVLTVIIGQLLNWMMH